jgi:hypothetical protein
MNEQASALIKILLDPQARLDERDDAASDLENFDAPEVAEALATVACSTDEDDVLLATAGESLAGIWVRAGAVPRATFEALAPAAKVEAAAKLNASGATHPES